LFPLRNEWYLEGEALAEVFVLVLIASKDWAENWTICNRSPIKPVAGRRDWGYENHKTFNGDSEASMAAVDLGRTATRPMAYQQRQRQTILRLKKSPNRFRVPWQSGGHKS
jgi:hypothetical protein